MAFTYAFSFSFTKKNQGDVMEVEDHDLKDSSGEADP